MKCASMAILSLLEGLTVWICVSFVLVSSVLTLPLPTHQIFCVIGWFLTQLFVITWKIVKKLPGNQKNLTGIYRPGADDGLWCCLLVPLTVLGEITSVYKIQKHIHLQDGVVLSNDLVFCFLCSSAVLSSRTILHFICTSVWLLPLCLSLDSINSVILILLCLSLYYGVHKIPRCLPKCFSVGEISVLLQLTSLIVWRSLNSLKQMLMEENFQYPLNVRAVSVIGVTCASISTFAAVYLQHKRFPLFFYIIYGVVALVLAFPSLYFYLGRDPISWLLIYLFTNSTRMFLLLYWSVCSILAVTVVHWTNVHFSKNAQIKVIDSPKFVKNIRVEENTCTKSKNRVKHSTVIRKYFHIVVLVVYVPGLIFDVGFLLLGSAVTLAVFILLEAIRILRVPPFGEAIHEAFSLFIDEKDAGKFIFTHIYLLIGLSAPIWISCRVNNQESLLPLYSGVLSLAVGDTAASIGGSWVGLHRWPGTKKTVEGTVCCTFSQMIFLLLLTAVGALEQLNVIRLMFAVILVSCFESFTLQIDNLVLPLLTFSLLSAL